MGLVGPIALLLSVLLTAAPALAAVAFDTVTSNQKSGSGTTLTQSHTVTAGGSDRAIYLLCGLDDNVITLTATYAGQAMTEVLRQQSAAGGNSVWIFRRLNPATGPNNWVVTQSVADNMICAGISLTGVDQTTPETDSDSNCPTSSTTTVSLTLTTAAGELLLDILGIRNTGHVITVGADQTERMNLTEGTAYQAAASTQPGSFGGRDDVDLYDCRSALLRGHFGQGLLAAPPPYDAEEVSMRRVLRTADNRHRPCA
ncbi:MAG TPA: hypothetical protein VNO43_06805 [Candidatus Eisenbacteria bacterium]|nr:hypothetical protein [Candidatus Eisenbacteria bacterium]